MFSRNFQIQIKGGTLAKIIERTTNEMAPDNAFVDAFLLTYRTFINPTDLLESLLQRYNLQPPLPIDQMPTHERSQFETNLKKSFVFE